MMKRPTYAPKQIFIAYLHMQTEPGRGARWGEVGVAPGHASHPLCTYEFIRGKPLYFLALGSL
jgi:hypothetical protein